jgi:hypothetical protein
MAGVRASFNPLAAYYSDPAKAEKMSSTPLAEQRDSAGFQRQADDYERRFLTNLAGKRNPTTP